MNNINVTKKTHNKVICYFNKILFQDNKPTQILKEAPYLFFTKEEAEDICEEMLESRIIDSYFIPQISQTLFKFVDNYELVEEQNVI